ncbi:transcriptional regulator domain-containing protein [Roseateles albus]|uniref:Uncharacterized protein n=1 Tax=Roseateles albus TaxID=2987525 RepID=A0ABT5KKE3_9BURK|nr:hypothetical protein [Roseateles albus]MDC8774378.1 hypothetical protein [Roseateles albus]
MTRRPVAAPKSRVKMTRMNVHPPELFCREIINSDQGGSVENISFPKTIANWRDESEYEVPSGVDKYSWLAWESLRRNLYFQRFCDGCRSKGSYALHDDVFLEDWGLQEFKWHEDAYRGVNSAPLWNWGLDIKTVFGPRRPNFREQAKAMREKQGYEGRKTGQKQIIDPAVFEVLDLRVPSPEVKSALVIRPTSRTTRSTPAAKATAVSAEIDPKPYFNPNPGFALQEGQMAVVFDFEKLSQYSGAVDYQMKLLRRRLFDEVAEYVRSSPRVIKAQVDSVSKYLRVADAMLDPELPTHSEILSELDLEMEVKKFDLVIRSARHLIYDRGYLGLMVRADAVK